MREIKFRAWLKDERIMLSVYVLDQTGNAGRGTHFPKSKGHNEHGTQFVFNIDDAELMQFTGLLDKSGKEIYESDIIKIEHPHKSRTFDGPVEWLDYGWGCKDFHFSHFDSPVDIFSEGTEYIEVIGNIYEHKDLLG